MQSITKEVKTSTHFHKINNAEIIRTDSIILYERYNIPQEIQKLWKHCLTHQNYLLIYAQCLFHKTKKYTIWFLLMRWIWLHICTFILQKGLKMLQCYMKIYMVSKLATNKNNISFSSYEHIHSKWESKGTWFSLYKMCLYIWNEFTEYLRK